MRCDAMQTTTRAAVLHDDMHTGNVIVERETGQIKVIDYELGVASPLPFDPRSTVSFSTAEPPPGGELPAQSAVAGGAEGGAAAAAVEHDPSEFPDPRFGAYRSNPMIGDRGTQCDSLEPNCHCNWPFEFVLPPNIRSVTSRVDLRLLQRLLLLNCPHLRLHASPPAATAPMWAATTATCSAWTSVSRGRRRRKSPRNSR